MPTSRGSWRIKKVKLFGGQAIQAQMEILALKKMLLDFPSGIVDKNPPANAGDRFNLWFRMIPHATEQIRLGTTAVEAVLWSPGTTTTEPLFCNYWSPCALEPVLHHERSHCSERPAQLSEEDHLLTATRQSLSEQKGPNATKKK